MSVRRVGRLLGLAALLATLGGGPAFADQRSTAQFEAYVDARRDIEQVDAELGRLLETPDADLSPFRSRLGAGLRGRLGVDDFLLWHAWVQRNPVLLVRVEERLDLARVARGTITRRPPVSRTPISRAPGSLAGAGGRTPSGAIGPPPVGAGGPPPVGAGGPPPTGSIGRPPAAAPTLPRR